MQFPYRYSYLQEELLELRRDFATRWPRWCGCLHPHEFFLTTEEIHALLADPIKLGSHDIGSQRVVVEDKDDNLRHIVHANSEVETVISRDEMLDLGWSEAHIRWLLSQVGVPDDDPVETDTGTATQRSSPETDGVTTSSPRYSFTEPLSEVHGIAARRSIDIHRSPNSTVRRAGLRSNVSFSYKRHSIPLEHAVEHLAAKLPDKDLSREETTSAAIAARVALPGAVSLDDELADLGLGSPEPSNERAKATRLPPISSAGAGNDSEEASSTTEDATDLTLRPVRKDSHQPGIDRSADAADLFIARISKTTEDMQSQLSDLAAKVELSNQEMKEQIADLVRLLHREGALAKAADA